MGQSNDVRAQIFERMDTRSFSPPNTGGDFNVACKKIAEEIGMRNYHEKAPRLFRKYVSEYLDDLTISSLR